MLRRLIHRRIAAFERSWGYDMTYARDILAAGSRPALALAKIGALTARHDGLPAEAWHAARIAAAIHEDCGPCAQLVTRMAERAGVDPAILRAVVRGDDAALPADPRLAVRFVRAALARDAEADALRDAVQARFGRAGLVSLSFALTAARIYPTLKYALGHGRACARVEVGGEIVPRLPLPDVAPQPSV